MASREPRPDPIRVIEAGYAGEADDARWLDEIVRAASAYDIGGGVIAFTARVGRRARVELMRRSDGASDRDALAIRRRADSLPPRIAREALAPSEFVGNVAYRLSRLAQRSGISLETIAGADSDRFSQTWAMVSGDPAHRALTLCFPAHEKAAVPSPDTPFPHRARRPLGLVGAHLGAALRLRSAFRPTADDEETEAVLTPGGKVLHAQGAATPADARTSLIEAVLSSERARGRLRRAAPDEALQIWAALVQGRWTILDTVERDGKRLLLARRNPLGAPGVIDLSQDERDVTWLAALGHSLKYIAYELGHPLPTVASRLRRVMRKLRVGSRAELLTKLGTVG